MGYIWVTKNSALAVISAQNIWPIRYSYTLIALLKVPLSAAAALLQRKTDERVIHLNPSDHALVMPLIDPALTLVPDPTIERGGLRIDTEDGGVEDGPAQWRQAIAEALGQC